MQRSYIYLVLFAAAVFLQLLLFDNVSIWLYLCPLVYISFIILLPVDTPPVLLLLSALAIGMTMDFTMGVAGLNTLATLPVAFQRPFTFKMFHARAEMREKAMPSPQLLGLGHFLGYAAMMVLLHHTIFFVFEGLSLQHILYTVLRIVVSSLVTIGCTWLMATILTGYFSRV